MFTLCVTIRSEEGKIMAQEVYTATEVRKNWSDIIDIVQNRPIKVSRNKKNTFSLIPLYMWELLLEEYSFNLKIEEDEDEGYIASFEGLDLIAAEATKEETIDDLKEQLLEYADMVIEDLNYYSRDKERMRKFPHLLKVWLFPEKLNTFING